MNSSNLCNMTDLHELQVLLCFPKCSKFIHARVASVLIYLLKPKTPILMVSGLECCS